MTTKEIILLVILIVTLIILVTVFITLRKIEKYKASCMDILVPKNEDYYRSLEVEQGNLIRYYEENASFIEFKFKSKGDFDEISSLQLKKHYTFFKNKIFYLINGVLSEKLDVIEIDNQKYIKLNDKIKSLQILVSYGNHTNLLVKYKVIKENESFRLEVDNKEVSLNDE